MNHYTHSPILNPIVQLVTIDKIIPRSALCKQGDPSTRPTRSGSVNRLHPIPKPAGFLIKHVDQDQGGDRYGDDGVKYAQNNDVYQKLGFDGHGSPPAYGFNPVTNGSAQTQVGYDQWVSRSVVRWIQEINKNGLTLTMTAWFNREMRVLQHNGAAFMAAF